MKEAPQLFEAYLGSIQDPAAAASLFAEDGAIELPTIGREARGPVEIEQFLIGLLSRVPDFRFKNVRMFISTPDQAFAEY